MNKVNTKVHGIIDYLFIGFLWISPMIFGLEEKAAMATNLLGSIHLAVTIFTNFELGLFRFIPIKIHALIELIVPFLIIILAFFLGMVESDLSRNYFLGVASMVFVTWLVTDYKSFIDYKNF